MNLSHIISLTFFCKSRHVYTLRKPTVNPSLSGCMCSVISLSFCSYVQYNFPLFLFKCAGLAGPETTARSSLWEPARTISTTAPLAPFHLDRYCYFNFFCT